MDWAQAVIMGYDPKQIPILKEAARRHLLPSVIDYPLLKADAVVVPDFQRIPIREKTQFIKTLILPFFTRGVQKKLQRREPKPLFDNSKCIRCLRCVNICPAKALTLSGDESTERRERHICADYSKCIRCYCCHEVCPVNAIKIEGKE